MVPNTFGKNYVANEKTQHTPRAQGLGKVGKAYSFFCLKGRELNYFGRWENMQIFHWGEESEESHPHCHFIQFQVWKQVYDYFWAFLSLVISFFCFLCFLLAFFYLVISFFLPFIFITNGKSVPHARGGGMLTWILIHWGIWKFENFFCDGPMKEAHWKNINKIWTC